MYYAWPLNDGFDRSLNADDMLRLPYFEAPAQPKLVFSLPTLCLVWSSCIGLLSLFLFSSASRGIDSNACGPRPVLDRTCQCERCPLFSSFAYTKCSAKWWSTSSCSCNTQNSNGRYKSFAFSTVSTCKAAALEQRLLEGQHVPCLKACGD